MSMQNYADETLAATARTVAELRADGATLLGEGGVPTSAVAEVMGLRDRAARARLTACPGVESVAGVDPETYQAAQGWVVVDEAEVPSDD